MSDLANNNLQHVAFAKAICELANVSVCGVGEQLTDVEPNVFKINYVYLRLGDKKVMTSDGIRNENAIRLNFKNSFILETDNSEHFLEFIGSDLDNPLFQRSVDNFKSAVLDVYGNVLAQYGIQLNT